MHKLKYLIGKRLKRDVSLAIRNKGLPPVVEDKRSSLATRNKELPPTTGDKESLLATRDKRLPSTSKNKKLPTKIAKVELLIVLDKGSLPKTVEERPSPEIANKGPPLEIIDKWPLLDIVEVEPLATPDKRLLQKTVIIKLLAILDKKPLSEMVNKGLPPKTADKGLLAIVVNQVLTEKVAYTRVIFFCSCLQAFSFFFFIHLTSKLLKFDESWSLLSRMVATLSNPKYNLSMPPSRGFVIQEGPSFR